MEEANEEAEHKGWCDTELSTNEQTRKEKTEAVETLHAEIDELEASIAQLTEQITELTKAVAELDAAVAKATSIREEEKAKNTVTIKDSQDAQTAVAQALSVLKDFYAKAADATSFVQEPEIFDEPCKARRKFLAQRVEGFLRQGCGCDVFCAGARNFRRALQGHGKREWRRCRHDRSNPERFR